MLISALNEYYDILKSDGKVVPDGFSKVSVHKKIMLTPEGEISQILDCTYNEKIMLKNNKTKVIQKPISILLPKRTQKTSIDLNIIEHRPLYIFGLNYNNGYLTVEDNTNKAKKSHKIFVEGNLKFTEGMTSDIVLAYRKFLKNWVPEQETENQILLLLGKKYSKYSYCFALDGHPEIMLQDDKEIKEKVISQFKNKAINSKTTMCAIIGEKLSIKETHNKIKGIPGGQSSGCVFVCVNNKSEESYGKTQGYNSNISTLAMEKYTTALNTLLEDTHHRTFVDLTSNKKEKMTLVYWAMSKNGNMESDIFNAFLFGDNKDDEVNKALNTIISNLKNGITVDYSKLNIDESINFYIVGLIPNNSRIAVKFIYYDKFGEIIKNVRQHQLDMLLDDTKKNISIEDITKELVSPKSNTEKVSSPLISSLFMSILNGTKYPDSLLSTVIKRIKLDSDNDKNNFIKMNYKRIGIIKACLNRKMRIQNKEEEIKMSLDKENKNPAYLCGRLFAVLEKTQQEASGNSLNRTIKDAYFSSACSRPATVFPKLLMLNQHHLKKLEYSLTKSKQVGEIMNMLGSEFPNTLCLDDQGKFILGYYQQYQSFFVSEQKQENN